MILIKSMEQTNIFENYKKSLKQKYNAAKNHYFVTSLIMKSL